MFLLIGGACDCAVPLWFWSTTADKCFPCEAQGYILIRYSFQSICTRLISSSLPTYSANKSTCTTLG